VRTSTFVMIGFAVLFGLLAVFLSQVWLNNQADQRMKSLEANRKPEPVSRTIVVADKALRFGDELKSSSLREVPWPEAALPAGAFGKIADLTSGKRIALLPIDTNEAILASKITGPGQRATLSALLGDGMKAVTVRVNDVEGVAGFVLPGDHVDVLLTRTGEKNTAINDVVIQDVRVLAIDQLADEKTDKPSVVKAVTLEVDATDGQKVALASTVGTLSLLLRKAGELADGAARRVTSIDLGKPIAPSQQSHFVTVGVIRPSKQDRVEYTVPVEGAGASSAELAAPGPARD
jgi:pilus assembly protein CpaB